MSFSFEHRQSMKSNELLIHTECPDESSSFYEQMLVHNHVRGLLAFGTEYVDGKRTYRYQLGSKQSLAERLEQNKLSFGQLRDVLWELIGIIEEGMNYLIDENDYVLRPDCIFFKTGMEQLYLCYCPMYQKELREQLSELFEYLMSHIDYKDSTAVILVYELYMRTKEKSCSFSDLHAVLLKSGEESGGDLVEAEALHEATGGFFGARLPRHEADDGGAYAASERIEDEKVSMEESTGYCLKASREEHTINIHHFPFYIEEKEDEKPALFFGMEKEQTKNKPYKSPAKLQAKLSAREDAVYIEDMKSTKGTFVNGCRIAGNEVRKLRQGDRVLLADVSYRFLKIN